MLINKILSQLIRKGGRSRCNKKGVGRNHGWDDLNRGNYLGNDKEGSRGKGRGNDENGNPNNNNDNVECLCVCVLCVCVCDSCC